MRGRAYDLAKRVLDVAAAAAGLLVGSCLMLPAAVAVYVSMGRPVLFRQLRPGRGARLFTLFKLRTMRVALGGGAGAADDALRLTGLGRFLRAASIDELPTLVNVLRGDMSLVGPRPLLERYLDRYTDEQARRHEVLPGITGWAQVNGRNALSWDEKLALDVWYVDHRSFALDLEILALTVVRVLSRQGITHGKEATMPEFMGSQQLERSRQDSSSKSDSDRGSARR